MNFYVKERLFEKDGEFIKLTNLESIFLKQFKNKKFVEFEELASVMYDSDVKLYIDPMKEVKYRVCKKCDLLCIPRYKKGYVMITDINFVEE